MACLVRLRLNDSDPGVRDLFRDLHGEGQAPQPGFGDLVAVLVVLGLRFESGACKTDSTSRDADLNEAELPLAEARLVADDARSARVRVWAESRLTEMDGRPARLRRGGLADADWAVWRCSGFGSCRIPLGSSAHAPRTRARGELRSYVIRS